MLSLRLPALGRACRGASLGAVDALLLLRPEPLVEGAVPSCVVCFINQLLIVKLLKVSLNHVLVLLVGGSDEGIVRDVQPLPEVCELRREPVAMGLRVDAGLGSRLGWLDMEVGRKESGEPYVKLHDDGLKLLEARGAQRIHLSLSHTNNHAVAVAILED